MSKPMELKTFTIWESLGGTMYAGESAEDVVNVDYEVYRKRLTDAELAAETYKAEAEFRAAAGYGYDSKIIRECDRKRSILERFATLPHYDEDQP